MKNRYDFVILFDAKDANPNGDPDAGNLPRIDAESGQGLITDVCLKRKVRNFIQTTQPKQRIYFTEGAVHNNQHKEAYEELKIDPKKAKPADRDQAKAWMCKNFFDVRAFGAVMSTEINCGQVRGPVQLSFARSIDPIVASEHAITRTSVTNERDIEKGRTMGRKFTVPYALYRAHGTVNPFLAENVDADGNQLGTGFSEADLELLLQALENAFQFDASAARPAGSMAVRSLIVFKHENQLGKAPSHKLLDLVQVKRTNGNVARSFDDYEVILDESQIPEGVTLIRRI
jgi:CRISPR-associated protein Csd2